jgi:hypothetical protein
MRPFLLHAHANMTGQRSSMQVIRMGLTALQDTESLLHKLDATCSQVTSPRGRNSELYTPIPLAPNTAAGCSTNRSSYSTQARQHAPLCQPRLRQMNT